MACISPEKHKPGKRRRLSALRLGCRVYICGRSMHTLDYLHKAVDFCYMGFEIQRSSHTRNETAAVAIFGTIQTQYLQRIVTGELFTRTGVSGGISIALRSPHLDAILRCIPILPLIRTWLSNLQLMVCGREVSSKCDEERFFLSPSLEV